MPNFNRSIEYFSSEAALALEAALEMTGLDAERELFRAAKLESFADYYRSLKQLNEEMDLWKTNKSMLKKT